MLYCMCSWYFVQLNQIHFRTYNEWLNKRTPNFQTNDTNTTVKTSVVFWQKIPTIVNKISQLSAICCMYIYMYSTYSGVHKCKDKYAWASPRSTFRAAWEACLHQTGKHDLLPHLTISASLRKYGHHLGTFLYPPPPSNLVIQCPSENISEV